MRKLINFCVSCDESFSDKFKFCPNCAGMLQSFKITPALQAGEGNTSSEIPGVAEKASVEHSSTSSNQASTRPYVERNMSRPENSKVNSSARESEAVPQATDSDTWYLSGPDELSKNYGGIGRLRFFGWMFILGVLSRFVTSVFSGSQAELTNTFRVVVLVVFAFSVWLVVLRLKNIGASISWVLLYFVPFGNFWIGYKCIAQQEGFVETRELDGPGKLIRFIYILFLALTGILLVAYFFGG